MYAKELGWPYLFRSPGMHWRHTSAAAPQHHRGCAGQLHGVRLRPQANCSHNAHWHHVAAAAHQDPTVRRFCLAVQAVEVHELKEGTKTCQSSVPGSPCGTHQLCCSIVGFGRSHHKWCPAGSILKFENPERLYALPLGLVLVQLTNEVLRKE